MRSFVYDLDGTLFDSRAAVKEAYRQAGIDMPDDAWGKPWQSWCPITEHSLKVRIYEEMLNTPLLVPTLPPIEVVREMLEDSMWVGILTGASHEAVRGLMKREGLEMAHLIGWSATPRHKAEKLKSIHRDVTYVDDEDVSGFIPRNVTFVRYVGQTPEQLKEDMKWMPSFSPPART